jgi:hypothetical protein
MANSALQRTSARSHVFLLSRSSRRSEAAELGTLGAFEMHEDDKREFIANYLRYLRWNRVASVMPSTREEMDKMLADSKSRADENPYQDEIWDLFSWTHDEPDTAWEVIRDIVAQAEEPDLGQFGAGDLETFVHVQAVPFAEAIEIEIRSNHRFRKAFESVNIGSTTPAHVGRRFNTALRDSGVSEEHIIDWWRHEPGA